MRAVAEALGTGEEVSWNDGLLISSQDWWVSVRESNTEPLLRLNVEAKDDDTVAKLRDTALAIIRKER
jgi:phosphomannomutase